MASKATPTHLVVFGRPGSGKSSLAERLSAQFGYQMVRTGEMLREAGRRGGDLGRRVNEQLKDGNLVPDRLISDLLKTTLRRDDHAPFLFDGFPRTIGQVPVLEGFERTLGFQVGHYLDVDVARETAVGRMAGRRVCPACGTTYHVNNKPPRVAETCDLDGTRLEQRPDDKPEIIRQRQAVYERHASPILDHYKTEAADRFRVVDGGAPFADVYRATCRALGLPSPPGP